MFEKESGVYADRKCGTIETVEKKFCRIDYQNGANFGYNKGKEEAKDLLKDVDALFNSILCGVNREEMSTFAQRTLKKVKQYVN